MANPIDEAMSSLIAARVELMKLTPAERKSRAAIHLEIVDARDDRNIQLLETTRVRHFEEEAAWLRADPARTDKDPTYVKLVQLHTKIEAKIEKRLDDDNS